MKHRIVVGILVVIVGAGAVTFGSRFLHSAPSLADCARDTYDDLRCDAYVRATFAHDMPTSQPTPPNDRHSTAMFPRGSAKGETP